MKVAVLENPTDLEHNCCYKVDNLDWIVKLAAVGKDFVFFLEDKILLGNKYFLTVWDNTCLEDWYFASN